MVLRLLVPTAKAAKTHATAVVATRRLLERKAGLSDDTFKEDAR